MIRSNFRRSRQNDDEYRFESVVLVLLVVSYFAIPKRQHKRIERNAYIPMIQTCSITNTMTNTEMINRHAATAMAVIAVVAGVMRPNALLPLASLAVFSFPLIPNRPSSPNCCCSIPFAMRRLPAGDAFMHPPENNWQRKQKQNPNEQNQNRMSTTINR